ncbi:MAG: AMP-binding protein, partial [Chromatiaceae bacterium]|nr:AMP-binding protein [Chromatiaceae bacterium]
MSDSLSALILDSAHRTPRAPALVHRNQTEDYATLAEAVECGARRLLALGLGRRERVAVWLEKRPEAVHALFAAAHAGGVFVPINPLLRPEQV